jgi:hypothetical protein
LIKVSLEVVRALTGMPLTKDMELKLSGTTVLELLKLERKEGKAANNNDGEEEGEGDGEDEVVVRDEARLDRDQAENGEDDDEIHDGEEVDVDEEDKETSMETSAESKPMKPYAK